MPQQAELAALLSARRDEILRLAQAHGVTRLRVFGSVVRQDGGSPQDVDLLYTASANTPPWFPAGLKRELEALLGVPVDLVEEEYLSPYLRERILHEARSL